MPDTFIGYLVIAMILGLPIVLLLVAIALFVATRDIGEDWSKKRPAKPGATASPDAGAQPAG